MPTANPDVTQSVAHYIVSYMADIGVTTVFGVISIHNMPILDVLAAEDRIRFVPARGEAGAMNMADAYARVSGEIGVVLTSTGTAAGNAAGAQVEALTAGTPLLHITTQVDLEFADRDRAAIHDVPRQPDMLRAISKSYFRAWSADATPGALAAAVSDALSAPRGPVTFEIPVDVQRSDMTTRPALGPACVSMPGVATAAIDDLAQRVRNARRPMLWLGGGARGATVEARELVRRGFTAVTSTNGRAVVEETNPSTLGAFNMTPAAQRIYRQADLMLVVGSRLRGNETHNNRMTLPSPLIQIDADASQAGRNYPVDLFVHADAREALALLIDRLPEALDVDRNFHYDVAVARAQSEGELRSALGPYQEIAETLQTRISAGGHPWVRDVTICNSTFGNRYVQIADPRHGVHALGGGIGQGVAMGVGAALAGSGAKTVVLLGDGGTMLGQAEMITAVEEQADLVFVLMNDQAYGVIRNIQDAQYGGRRHYSALKTPDFEQLCRSIDLPHRRIGSAEAFPEALDDALGTTGPCLIEVDMLAIGPFAQVFAGPPAGAAGGQT
ncbi:thiamine pyrophosphate-binding protein [Cucumibacter marinus]|uniref:thiamine pyrophosphate-binding protein n=1 Tax=Cucumibacter marinus TaxID=1121252 RepID=UPI0003FF2894|nr:thiamine pyrophosphate-binding protein [Cucumibacter marinus]